MSFTPTSNDAKFINNVLVEKSLKIADGEAIFSTWLDSRFTAEALVASNAVSQEATDRASADTTLQSNINSLSSTVNTNKGEFDAYVLSNNTALGDEIADRQEGDNIVQGNLDDHINNTYGPYIVAAEAALNQETADRQAAITTESNARQTADTNLQAGVDANTQLVATEKSNLKNELLYGAGNDENTDNASKDPDKLDRVAARLADVEGQIDAFSPDSIETKVQELITNHDAAAAAAVSRLDKLEEYFSIDESDPTNVVITIKSGAKLVVLGELEQGE